MNLPEPRKLKDCQWEITEAFPDDQQRGGVKGYGRYFDTIDLCRINSLAICPERLTIAAAVVSNI